MRGFIVGMIAGLVLGTAISAAAGYHAMIIIEYRNLAHSIKTIYLRGIADGIASLGMVSTLGADANTVSEKVIDCMQSHDTTTLVNAMGQEIADDTNENGPAPLAAVTGLFQACQ